MNVKEMREWLIKEFSDLASDDAVYRDVVFRHGIPGVNNLSDDEVASEYARQQPDAVRKWVTFVAKFEIDEAQMEVNRYAYDDVMRAYEKYMRNPSRDEMLEILIERAVDVALDDHDDIYHMVIHGCRGLATMNDEELEEHFYLMTCGIETRKEVNELVDRDNALSFLMEALNYCREQIVTSHIEVFGEAGQYDQQQQLQILKELRAIVISKLDA